MSQARYRRCKHCNDIFPNAAKLGGHVRAHHPEQHKPTTRVVRPMIPARGPRPGGSLKNETDTYPARP